MISPSWLFLVMLWPTLSFCSVLHYARRPVTNDTSTSRLSKRQDPGLVDEVELSFIQRWAAIGDSFTAGIGSGGLDRSPGAYECSRYTYTWPNIVNRAIGSDSNNFQYLACSGARSYDVFQQVQQLEGNLDLVMLTAGGNDLCLAAMLVRCVFVAYFGEEVCHEVINKARENINTILKPNIREILNALKQKVKRGGIVVYLGYAPFFNTENEDCANPEKYQWALATYGELDFFGRSDFLRLTIERRRVFNDLVHQINRAIREVVEELHNDRNKVYDIGFADWSFFPELVDGQFCSPRSTGTYPDFHQPELLFFKQDTRPDRHGPLNNELRRRDETEGVVRGNVTEGDGARPQFDRKPHAMFDGISGVKGRYYPPGTSRNPQTEVKRQLHRRAPAHPDCPGDNSFDWTLGFGLPDGLGQLFHPNPKGHEAMAAFALQTLATVKAQQLDIVVDSCEIQEDTFHCWRGQPLRQAYTQFETVNKLAKQFCERDVVAPPDWDDNWSFSKRYNIGTPEEVEFIVRVNKNALFFDKADCLAAMNGIINRCDTDSDINPLNLKYGGWHTRGNYQYEITPLYRRNHITRADGRCRGEYKVFYSKYVIEGRGWLGSDNGELLRDNVRRCAGKADKWEVRYYENPDEHNGWEWYASFHTHIWTSNRCFNNLKVQGRSKGYTHKWKANPQLERYEEWGCSGNGDARVMVNIYFV